MIPQIFERNHSFLIPTHRPPERDPCRGHWGQRDREVEMGQLELGFLRGSAQQRARPGWMFDEWIKEEMCTHNTVLKMKRTMDCGMVKIQGPTSPQRSASRHYALIHASMPFMLSSQKGRHADSFQILGWVLQGIVWAGVSFHSQNVLRVFQVREKPFLSIRR